MTLRTGLGASNDHYPNLDAESPNGCPDETESVVSDIAAALKITEFGFAKD
jgi:hypothetical protein